MPLSVCIEKGLKEESSEVTRDSVKRKGTIIYN